MNLKIDEVYVIIDFLNIRLKLSWNINSLVVKWIIDYCKTKFHFFKTKERNLASDPQTFIYGYNNKKSSFWKK